MTKIIGGKLLVGQKSLLNRNQGWFFFLLLSFFLSFSLSSSSSVCVCVCVCFQQTFVLANACLTEMMQCTWASGVSVSVFVKNLKTEEKMESAGCQYFQFKTASSRILATTHAPSISFQTTLHQTRMGRQVVRCLQYAKTIVSEWR